MKNDNNRSSSLKNITRTATVREGTEVDGIHPLFFENGRRPPRDRVSAGWAGVHPRPSTYFRGGWTPSSRFFFHLHTPPPPVMKVVNRCGGLRLLARASIHFFTLAALNIIQKRNVVEICIEKCFPPFPGPPRGHGAPLRPLGLRAPRS